MVTHPPHPWLGTPGLPRGKTNLKSNLLYDFPVFFSIERMVPKWSSSPSPSPASVEVPFGGKINKIKCFY